MSDTSPPPVFNPMPPVVVALFAVIALVELWFTLGPNFVGGAETFVWRMEAIERFGVNPQITHWMLENHHYPLEHLARFVTFSFVHGSMINAVVSCALFLAMGKMVGSAFSPLALLVFFTGSAAVGAVVFSLAAPEGGWLFGSFAGIYGLIGAYTFMMWITLRVHRAPQGQAFHLIAFLMGIQLLFGMIFGGNSTWIADLIGFVTGFILSFFFIPGGLSRVIAMLRKS